MGIFRGWGDGGGYLTVTGDCYCRSQEGTQDARHLAKRSAVHREEMSHAPHAMEVKNLFLMI